MSRIIEMYRRVPDLWALVLVAVVSWALAAITGIAGGIACVYLYDRGMSKGNDLAVLISGLLAVGTFAFVLLFTWLRKLHHEVSSRTPWFAWLFCLASSLLVTFLLWPGESYLELVLMGWMAILIFGLVGLILSQRLFIPEPD
jgi:hypothetical protein